MAYSSFNNALARVGSPNNRAPTIWTYRTTDALTTLDTSGYFNAVADRLKVGDWILVSSSTTWGILIVQSNTRDTAASPPVFGVVDTTNALSAGTIDSD
jgi:hypothetical protein